MSIYFPILISSMGIIACWLTSIFGLYIYKVTSLERIGKALKYQLIISTVLTLLLLPVAAWMTLPEAWNYSTNGKLKQTNRWYCVITTGVGLISGLLIGLSTDYYTSSEHYPVRELSEVCKQGAAINIIYGLALGYLSTIVPILLLALTIIVGMKLCGMFGVA